MKDDINFSNLKKKNYHIGKINDLKDYYQNLQIQNYLKTENIKNNFHYQKKIKIKKVLKNLDDSKYFTNILNMSCKNIKKIIKSNKVITKKDSFKINKDKIYKSNNKKRYRKNKEELIYLQNFFELNKYQWNKKIIKELSDKLFLSSYSIYKWNWDKLRKLKQ